MYFSNNKIYFWESNFEMSVSKKELTKCISWRSNFENPLFEGDILEIYFVREQFWEIFKMSDDWDSCYFLDNYNY